MLEACSGDTDPVGWTAVPAVLEVTDCRLVAPGLAVELPTLRLAAGEVAALYGPSGGGKTSLLAAMFGVLRRAGARVTGDVRCAGRLLATMTPAERQHLLRHDVVFLAQDAHQALDPLQPVGAQIQQATVRSEAEAIAMLGRLGIDDAALLCRRLPHAISGGQAQRVLLAIAFLRTPALVVADEPSASLDGGSYAELVAQLRALGAAGAAVLLATHDQRLLHDLGARVYVLERGRFVASPTPALAWPERAIDAVGSVALLAAHGVTVRYCNRTVLDGVDFKLGRGEIVGVVGESGAGKTTLVKVLAGHRLPDAGRVQRPPRHTAVQLVCQDAYGSLTPRRRLAGLLAEARAPFFDAGAGATAVQLPYAVLERDREAMSGGERKRAALLRALAVHPDVLVLDEPTASLDRATAVAVLETLLVLQRSRGLAMVLVTHDLELARSICHRIVEVRGGRLCEL